MSNEIIGIVGAIILLISMAIPSTHRRQNIAMRLINSLGSIVMIIYSWRLEEIPYANIFLNAAICLINLYYITKLVVSIIQDSKGK